MEAAADPGPEPETPRTVTGEILPRTTRTVQAPLTTRQTARIEISTRSFRRNPTHPRRLLRAARTGGSLQRRRVLFFSIRSRGGGRRTPCQHSFRAKCAETLPQQSAPHEMTKKLWYAATPQTPKALAATGPATPPSQAGVPPPTTTRRHDVQPRNERTRP
jgi:hypothetical protein